MADALARRVLDAPSAIVADPALPRAYDPAVPDPARRRPAGELNGSRGERAYESLRAAIQAGQYRQGERIREVDVAAWLGISRTPVRDALKRLEAEGLLMSAPRRGLVVAQLDQQQVSELYGVRIGLEGLAARLAAEHATTAEIEAMRELIDRQARTRSSDVTSLQKLNTLFHGVVTRAARNRYLTHLLDTFESSLGLLPGTTYSARGRAAQALEEHSHLVDAVARRDGDRAESVAREHIRSAERIRLRMVSGAPEPGRSAARARVAVRPRSPRRRTLHKGA